MKKKRTLAPRGPAWKAAEAYGFDMSVVESNLRRTPEELVLMHDRIRRTIQECREALRKQNG